jgi:hypothetical protein
MVTPAANAADGMAIAATPTAPANRAACKIDFIFNPLWVAALQRPLGVPQSVNRYNAKHRYFATRSD